MSDIEPPPDELELPPSLRWLKTLVTILTGVMIVGIVLLVGLLFVKLRASPTPVLDLPANLALPDGARPAAVTLGADWVGVVTRDDRILIYDRATGALRQDIAIETGQE